MARINAQEKFTISAPNPTAVNEIASGVDGLLISYMVLINTEMAGTNKSSAKNLLSRFLACKLQPIATKIKILTEASSRKSMLSANRETEPIFTAKENSTKKYARFAIATTRTTFLIEFTYPY